MFSTVCGLFLFVISLSIAQINGQTGGTLPSGDSYVCVPPGFCDNGGYLNAPGIDPRIVTPGQPCPVGSIPCYTQGPGSICGLRFVSYTNGQDGPVTVAQAFPWQAWLQNDTNIFAGNGVLLDNYHVLTAAHKVAGNVNTPTNEIVRLGVFSPANSPNQQNRTVAQIRIHPAYNPQTLMNDIAILRLSSPIALSSDSVNTACLPPRGSSFATFVGCVVAGWGQTTFEDIYSAPTNPMKQVFVNITTYQNCRNAFLNGPLPTVDQYLDEDGEICAGGQAQRDACTQDGGAPLMCPDSSTGKYYIAGLVIWGKNCGQPGIYGVYANVPYYRDWIDSTITCLNNNSC